MLGVLMIMIPAAAVADASERAALSGRVLDELGGALLGATVSVHGLSGERFEQSKLTDDHGDYSFAELPDGEYAIEAELRGFVSTAFRPVRINFPMEVHWNFKLAVADLGVEGGISASSDLVGELLFRGTRMSSTRICLTRADGTGRPTCTVTNRLGQYFLSVEPGLYDVTIDRSGLENKRRLDMSSPGAYRNRLPL